jgi:hypothetical protein
MGLYIIEPGRTKIERAALNAMSAANDKEVSEFAFIMLCYAEIDFFHGFSISVNIDSIIEVVSENKQIIAIKCTKENKISSEMREEFVKYIELHHFGHGMIITSDYSYYYEGGPKYKPLEYHNLNEYRDILNIFLDLRLFRF